MPQNPFADLQAYCMFVGYGRGGTTLVRSMLDAHPNIIIANEFHAIRHVKLGMTRQELFEHLLANSQKCATPGKWKTGYQYLIPGQWQGRFDPMLVIGDKEAGGTSNQILRNPRIVGRLRKRVELPIRAIFCHRNPFDQITTACRRTGGDPSSEKSLSASIVRFDRRCRGVAKARQKLERSERIDLWHEAMVADPQQCLRDLCEFLGVEVPGDWLKATSSLVFESAHRRRDDGNWTSALKEQVYDITRQHEVLVHYNWTH